MKTKGLKKLNILTLALLFAATVCLIATATFAAATFSAKQNYALDSATNYFSLQADGGREYYSTYTLTAGQSAQSVTVYNNVVNSAYDNETFDLLAYVDGDTTVSLAGSTPTVKASDDGKCYIFKNLTHSSPSVSGSMNLSLALNGATAAEKMNVVVLKADGHNVYVSDFFELQLENSETYYNTFYEQDYGTWTTAASGTYTTDDTAITVTGVGTFGFYNAGTGLITTETSLVGVLNNGMLTLDFDSLEMSNGMTVAGSNKFVFTLENGYYVNSAYGLRVSLNAGAITIEYLPFTNYEAYRNLFFTKTVTIEHEFNIDIPCRINLLYSGLVLGADTSISHHYGGSYSIEAIPSNLTPIDNDDFTLTINCPRAYYYTGLDGENAYGVRALVTNGANLVKTSDCVDFTDPDNATLLSSLITDAKNYFAGYTPTYVWSDFILPAAYQNYGVTYSYSSNNAALSKVGNVTRGTDNVTVALTASVWFNGALQGTEVKNIVVAGTSNEAKTAALATLVQTQIDKSTNLENGNNVLDKNVELSNLLSTLVSSNDGLGITTAFRMDGGTLPFVVQYVSGSNTLSAEAYVVEVNPTAGTIALYNSDDVQILSANLSAVTSLYLEKPTFVLNGGTNSIIFSMTGTTDKTVSVYLNGMTFAEKTAYIERFVETLYLTGSNVPFDILHVANGGLYRGTKDESVNRVLDSTLGITSMNYTIYQMTDADYASYVGGAPLTSLASKEDKTSLFTVSDGAIYVGAISAPDGYTLVMLVSFAFDSETEGETSYVTNRTIILPASGIGGTDYTQYTSGNTYADYFESLENHRLIDSTADAGAIKGTGHEFKTFASGVSLEMTVVNSAAVVNDDSETFCELVYNATGRFYQIDIDTDLIPARNTTVQLQVVFYIMNNSVRTDISTQYYSFTIPGIYKQGRDVTSAEVYARILAVYGTEEDGTYLLVDDAQAAKPSFDCSIATLTPLGVAATDTVDLKGIELLTGTVSMNFSGVRIRSLEPFSEFKTQSLTSLNLSNCYLTDALVTALSATSGRAHLYGVRLTSINLDGNAISGLTDANGNPYLYRTLTALSIADQRNAGARCFASVAGADDLVGLSVLDVSGNAVADFSALVECDRLTSVTLADNVAAEFTGKGADANVYYGSSGKVNVPVYVALSDKGVSVTGDTATLFTAEERIAALAINAVSYFRTQYDTITFPSLAYVTTTGGTSVAITVEYLIKNNASTAFTTAAIAGDAERIAISATLSDGDEVFVIASVTVGTATVYNQFAFLCKEKTT